MADPRSLWTRPIAGRSTARTRGRVLTAVVAALGLALAPIVVAASPAAAEDTGFLTIDKQIEGTPDNAPVAPGARFVYTIVVTSATRALAGARAPR